MKTKIIVLISIGFVFIAIAGRFLVFNRITTPSGTPIQNTDLQANITGPSSGSTIQNPGSPPSNSTGASSSASTMPANSGSSRTEPASNPSTNPANVRILFPPRVRPEDITTLTTSIRQIAGIESKVIRAENMQIYEIARAQAFSDTGTNALRDIVMVSTTKPAAIISSKHIPFTQDISPYFTPLVASLITSASGTFIPYALDPLVTVLHNELTTTPAGFSRDLFQHLIASPRSIPLPHINALFGVSPLDSSALRNGKEAYPGYTDILFTFVDQAFISQTPGILTYLTEIPTWDFTTFTTLIANISAKLPQCSSLPLQCLLRFQLTDIGFVHLSDLDLLRGGIPQGQRWEEAYTLTNFPSTTLGYPVDARGFVIPSSVQHPTNAYKRIEGYMKLASQQRLVSGSYTLSPFAETLQTQLLQNIYQYIRDQIRYGYISTPYVYLHNDDKFKERLRDVLEKKYNTAIFLQQYQQKK